MVATILGNMNFFKGKMFVPNKKKEKHLWTDCLRLWCLMPLCRTLNSIKIHIFYPLTNEIAKGYSNATVLP